MSIEFECDACQQAYRVHDELAGKSAQCPCGARLTIPHFAPARILEQDDLLAEFPQPLSPPVQPLTAAASQVDVNAVLNQSGQSAERDPADSGPGWLSAAGKIGCGGLAGLFFGAKALMRNGKRGGLTTTTQLLIICGVGLLGALVASLLIVKDVARNRKAAGLPMPALMYWYFANGFQSVLLWFWTVIFTGTLIAAALGF